MGGEGGSFTPEVSAFAFASTWFVQEASWGVRVCCLFVQGARWFVTTRSSFVHTPS